MGTAEGRGIVALQLLRLHIKAGVKQQGMQMLVGTEKEVKRMQIILGMHEDSAAGLTAHGQGSGQCASGSLDAAF